jgi:hypothetical protein
MVFNLYFVLPKLFICTDNTESYLTYLKAFNSRSKLFSEYCVLSFIKTITILRFNNSTFCTNEALDKSMKNALKPVWTD